MKKNQMFTPCHVSLEERHEYPAGTYYAIFPRPLLQGTKAVAVVIPDLDVAAHPSGVEVRDDSPTGQTRAESPQAEEVVEGFMKDIADFDLRKQHIKRPFKIASPSLEEMCLVEPEASESAHYVYAPDGALLARIHRTSGRLYPWPRRVRWHLEVAHGNRPPTCFSAPQGTIRAWTSFVIFSPLWVALIIFRLLGELIDSSDTDFVWGLPARAKWRTGVIKWGLDYHGVGSTYYANPEIMDPRIAYAQAIVHNWTPRKEKKNQS